MARFVAVGVETSWGVPTAPDWPVEVASESLSHNREFVEVKSVRTVSRRKYSLLSTIPGGDIVIPGNIQDLGPFIYGFYGTVDTTNPDIYLHTFPASTGTTGRSGVSLALDVQRDSTVRHWRYTGLKVVGMSFSGNQTDPLQCTFTLDGGKDVFYAGQYTGTHDTGESAATLVDSTASFPVDAFIGWTVNNTTDGSSGTITDNDATSITATLSGGAENDWDTSDAYTLSPPAEGAYNTFDILLPKDLSVSFDGGSTTICAQSFDLNAVWPVDRTVCLGSQKLSREPTESDTFDVNGTVTMLFEDAEMQDEYVDFNGTTEVDMQIVASDGTHSITFNMNKVILSDVSANISGRERLFATFAFESIFDATGTECMQTLLKNDDAVVT